MQILVFLIFHQGREGQASLVKVHEDPKEEGRDEEVVHDEVVLGGGGPG